jgi:hypothetical protein
MGIYSPERHLMERGPAEMRLDQAIALLKGKPGSIERLGPEFVQRARAAAVYADGVRDGAVLTTPLWPTHDVAPPRRIQNDHEPSPKGGRRMHIHIHGVHDDNAAERERADAEGVNGAQESKGRVGAKLVQRLSGPVTAYFIAADGDGNACLYQTADADDALDPGAISIKSKTLNADQRRAVTRDAARASVTLRSINERNRTFWQKHGS